MLFFVFLLLIRYDSLQPLQFEKKSQSFFFTFYQFIVCVFLFIQDFVAFYEERELWILFPILNFQCFQFNSKIQKRFVPYLWNARDRKHKEIYCITAAILRTDPRLSLDLLAQKRTRFHTFWIFYYSIHASDALFFKKKIIRNQLFN